MKYALISCLVNLWLLATASASVPGDSAVHRYFSAIAGKLKLGEPRLKKEEYEIRIWQKQGLVYGEAQMVYVVKKTPRKLQVVKFLINSDRRGFQYATTLNSTLPLDPKLWDRLVEQEILVLPSESAIASQLHPKNQKDSTWYIIESDGSVTIKARKTKRSVWFTDGESYHFEVFSANKYLSYSYANPHSYLRAMPEITELRKVVTILDELAVAFQSAKRL